MNWINIVQKSLNYIEDHLLENLNAEMVAKSMFTSSAYFQKIFRIVTGFTVSDYIRNRRLSLAGEEFATSRIKVIDAALKFGYESPESFTKAFTRFHGVTPSAVQKFSGKVNYFSPMNIQINVEGGFIMSRRLIPNVEKLYENRAENYMFPSCMCSAMSALNEEKAYDFSFFAGVTGDFFTQIWLEPKWRYNDSYSNVCKDTQLPIQYAFDACGYDYSYITRREIQNNKAEYTKRIVESIDKGLPVLTFGIVGPPVCSIICGYSDNGEVLIGWSQFTGETTEDKIFDHVFSENYFQVRDGLEHSEALIFFGQKKNRQTIGENIKRSILNFPALASMQSTAEVSFGKKAFDAWADSLLCDAYFQKEEQLVQPLDTYRSCVVQTGTNMHYMDSYLARALELCPELSAQIKGLRLLFKKEKEAFEKLIELQGGYFFEQDSTALLNKAFRTALSQQVAEVGRLYEEAAQFLSD